MKLFLTEKFAVQADAITDLTLFIKNTLRKQRQITFDPKFKSPNFPITVKEQFMNFNKSLQNFEFLDQMVCKFFKI